MRRRRAELWGEERDKTLRRGQNKRPASGGGKNDNGANAEENRGETRGKDRKQNKVLKANQELLRPGMVLFVGWLEHRGELAGMLGTHGFRATDRQIRLLGGVNPGHVLSNS